MRITKPRAAGRAAKLLVAAAAFAIAYLLVTQLIRANSETKEYLVTAISIASGTALEVSQLETSNLNLGASEALFARTSEEVVGFVAVAALPAGSPIPRWLLSEQAATGRGKLVLSPAAALASDLSAGSSVGIWVASKLEANQFQEPILIEPDAELVAILEEKDPFSGAKQQVELGVSLEVLPNLLRAVANRDQIFILARGGNYVG